MKMEPQRQRTVDGSSFDPAEDRLPFACLSLAPLVEWGNDQHDCSWLAAVSRGWLLLFPEMSLHLEDLSNILATPQPDWSWRISGMETENLVQRKSLQNGRQILVKQENMKRTMDGQVSRFPEKVNVRESVFALNG